MTDLAALESWHFWFTGRDALTRNLLRRYEAQHPIVDVGCGTGRFASAMSNEDGRSVVAIDRSAGPPPLPGAARLRAAAERLPLRSGAVRTVLARDVLEHVDDRAALAECHRVLRPGGLVVALVPALPALWSERDVAAEHRRRYRRETLRRAVDRSGLELVEMRGFQLALLPALAASRLAARIAPRSVLRGEERPPAAINRLFSAVNRAEAALARTGSVRPPIGSTLAVVARRP